MVCAARRSIAGAELEARRSGWLRGGVEMGIGIRRKGVRDTGGMISVGNGVVRLWFLGGEVSGIKIPAEVVEVVEETKDIICFCGRKELCRRGERRGVWKEVGEVWVEGGELKVGKGGRRGDRRGGHDEGCVGKQTRSAELALNCNMHRESGMGVADR